MPTPTRLAALLVLVACARESHTAVEAGREDMPQKIRPLLAEMPAGEAVPVQEDRVKRTDETVLAAIGPVMSGSAAPSKPAPVWRRYVALVDKPAADPCPPASAGWTGERLFRRGEVAALLGDKGVLPLPLERFCVYTWGGKSPPATPPQFAGPGAAQVVRVDADREVVVPQAGYLGGDPAARAALSDAFLRAAGAVPAGAQGPSVHAGVEGPAKVAVVDTVGFREVTGLDYLGAAARQRHGLAMAEVIAALRCPNGEAGCRGQTFHAQAFPYGPGSPLPLPGGGPLGSMASLAHAIGEATVRWRQGEMRGSPLIVNLSVGWDARHGEALTVVGQEATHTDLLATPSAAVPATVQAVHAAMVYATCLDVLAIAAAGNNPGAACEQTGLMAPASWERYPAPDRARCEALFGPLPAWRAGDPAVAVTARSLVYAAGGIDAAARPIPIARPGGTPARVLAAMQAVAGAGARQTDAWTGTSIAAASLSALAAQVWSHHRGLTPHQVIALLDASGTATGLAVDGVPDKRRARRIQAHGAFSRLCAVRYAGQVCPNPYAAPTMPAASAPAATIAPSTLAAVQSLACTTSAAQCGARSTSVTRCGAAGGAAPPAAAEPWVRPQPDTPLCPDCPIRGGRLTLSLHPDFTGASVVLNDPVLEFMRSDGTYIGARLAQVTVGAAGAEVDLSRYLVDLGRGAVTLASVLTSEGIRSGVLGFSVTDAAGGSSWLSSAVRVDP